MCYQRSLQDVWLETSRMFPLDEKNTALPVSVL